jgi:hypothetical protein
MGECAMAQLLPIGSRVVVGIALAVCLISLGNYWLGVGLFAPFDKKVLVASFAILGLAVLFLGPTAREIEEQRKRKRNSPE